MEKLPVQSLPWRGFAVFVTFMLAASATDRGLPAATGWEFARTIYWLCAPLGLVGYAFGFRILSVKFWRLYAVIFTLEITIRTALQAYKGHHVIPVTLIATAGIALTCLALFRYAELVRGGRTQTGLPRPIPLLDWLKTRRAFSQFAKSVFGRRGPAAGLVGAILGSSLIGSVALGIAVVQIEFGPAGAGNLGAALVIALIAIPASAMLVGLYALVLGLPFTWVVARLKLEGAFTYGLGGFILGLALLLGGAPSPLDGILKASGGVYGCVCGLLWWHLHRRHVALSRTE